MKKVRLIRFGNTPVQEQITALESAGYEALYEPLTNQAALRRLAEEESKALVIDLSRAPAQGRDMGLWLRRRKSTRNLPLIFLGGAPGVVEKMKRLLPDAVYADWSKVRSALQRAIARPPADPVVPDSMFAGYSRTPLTKKLGVKPGFSVALVGAPPDFERTLGPLPERVLLHSDGRRKRDLTICFVSSRRELDQRLVALVGFAQRGHVWIAWPKRSSGVVSDLTQSYVRRSGLESGLVDFKICAIDETWSGLCFAMRK